MIYDGYKYREETMEEKNRREEQEKIEAQNSQNPENITLKSLDSRLTDVEYIITGKEVAHNAK